MTPPASPGRFWQTRASALARRINIGAWLGRAAPATFFTTAGFAVAAYASRRDDGTLLWIAIAWMGVTAISGAVCWWRARPGFFTAADARVMLESQLRLDTRLTAAELGLVAWPLVPAALPPILRWQLRAPLGWLGAAALLIGLALLAPIPRDDNTTGTAGPPPALLQTETLLEALKELKIVEPQPLDELAERARELARRPSDEQYSHSALEAADALRNQAAVAATGLARNLESAASALRDSGRDLKSAAGRLAAALSGLRDGALPGDKDLLSKFPSSELDLSRLTPGQCQQLAQQLAAAGKAVAGIAGACTGAGQIAMPDGEGKIGPGRGGPGGGGESAPLALRTEASDAGAGELSGISGESLKRFALGDKLGTTSGAHDVDPTKAIGPISAGAVAGPAAGGEAVWVDRLTPAERAAVKKFFK